MKQKKVGRDSGVLRNKFNREPHELRENFCREFNCAEGASDIKFAFLVWLASIRVRANPCSSVSTRGQISLRGLDFELAAKLAHRSTMIEKIIYPMFSRSIRK